MKFTAAFTMFDPTHLIPLAQAAEDARFDSVCAYPEHVSAPTRTRTTDCASGLVKRHSGTRLRLRARHGRRPDAPALLHQCPEVPATKSAARGQAHSRASRMLVSHSGSGLHGSKMSSIGHRPTSAGRRDSLRWRSAAVRFSMMRSSVPMALRCSPVLIPLTRACRRVRPCAEPRRAPRARSR